MAWPLLAAVMPFGQSRLSLIRTTVSSQERASAMAQRLVAGGAACVHLQQVRSHYVWNGQAVDEDEWTVECRCTPAKVADLRHLMLQGHPYDLPIVESWSVRANADYVRWAREAALRQG